MTDALTYSPVGATLGELPPGTDHLDVERVVGHGRPAFARARARLFAWAPQRAAGFGVVPTTTAPAPGSQVTLVPGAGLAPVRLFPPAVLPRFRCEVVAVVDEPDRAGFAYGTLPGHPEPGEELFLLRLEPVSGRVLFRIRAFSRPGTRWSRALAPVVRLVQRAITRRYLRSLG